MSSPPHTRFSKDELNQCQSWSLPDVSSKKTIPSAEKEKKDQRTDSSSPEQPSTAIDVDAGESIEAEETEVKPLTAEQLQAITDEAEKEGYNIGYEKGLSEGHANGEQRGYEEGLASGKKAIADQCDRLVHIAEALLVPLETEHRYLETLLVDMVKQLSSAVVARELQTDSSHIVALIDTALDAMPATADKYALYLNSQDVELVEQHLHAIDKQFTYHIDDNLLPGGCRLETRQTVVDFSVEKRLQQVLDDFIHKRFAMDTAPVPVNNDQETLDSQPSPTEGEDTQEETASLLRQNPSDTPSKSDTDEITETSSTNATDTVSETVPNDESDKDKDDGGHVP